MRKDGELFVGGRFRFGGKKEAAGVCRGGGESMDFESDLLIINELELSNVKPRWRTYSAHTASVWHNSASAAPAASFLPSNRKKIARYS
jgi:hypothetical protein